MAERYLWIEQSTEDNLKASGPLDRERKQIRSHVQTHRRRHTPESHHNNRSQQVVAKTHRQRKISTTDALVSSLRPNRDFGRLTKRHPTRAPASVGNRITRQGELLDSRQPYIAAHRVRDVSFPWHNLTSSERASLAFYRLRTSQEWSGWQDTFFWNVLVLQVSHQSETVARSLIALSRIHEHMCVPVGLVRTRYGEDNCEQSRRATAALLSQPRISHFEALVSCLIMICYHGLRRTKASFLLLRCGARLLAGCEGSDEATLTERRNIDLQLRPLFNRLCSRWCSMADLSASFGMSVKINRNKQTVAIDKPVISESFHTLLEVRDCLEDILTWAHDKFCEQMCLSPPGESFHVTLHALADAWHLSLAASSLPMTAASIKSQKLLRAAQSVGMIIINTAFCPEESVYDAYEEEFENTIGLLERARPSAHNFGLDGGFIDMIAFVGTKCRDPLIRRRALQLLESEERLEGGRIASNPAIIIKALIALEEGILSVETCHDIPSKNRRRLICGKQFVDQGRIGLLFESADGSEQEWYRVSLAGASVQSASKASSASGDMPAAVFGIGYAEYLDSAAGNTYFRLDLDRFYFPIPKM